ncbi:hypothetical protein [Streptacidiphilus sp. EB129]|uniref:hypothetical protein n=1 Tax=Streptacidiphilus sp. EB129 TaxID=3156262 RepID=UPI0035169709
MPDVAQPTIAEVRNAAEAVKAAIDRHLAAVEARTGENDPGVAAAYEALARAADDYDEVLYDAYDEVTPFEVPHETGVGHYADPDDPEAISVLIRRDYLIADPLRLRAAALRIDGSTAVDPAPVAASSVTAALGALFGEYEPDEIAGRAEQFGLEEGDSTLWVTAADPAEPGDWLGEPFDDADPELLICRFDVSEVYDDELEVLDPEH